MVETYKYACKLSGQRNLLVDIMSLDRKRLAGISSNNPMAVPKVAVPRTLEGGDFRFFYWCRHYLGDALLTANEWEVAVMRDVYAGSVKFGNHICLPQVCWKGHFAKIHFCRMLYWHWRRSINAKGAEVMKRAHGLLLQTAWAGTGFPPAQQALPNPGTPLLEINFPFFFKLTPTDSFIGATLQSCSFVCPCCRRSL